MNKNQLKQVPSITNNTLLGGKAGYCLYLLSTAKRDTEAIMRMVENIVETLHNDISPTFGTGITGISQIFHLLVSQGVIDKADLEEVFDYFHQYLDFQCGVDIQEGHTDYLFGASGIIYYFLVNQDISADILNKHLYNFLHPADVSTKFGFEPNRHFPHINIGLAQGITGTGIVLLRALTDKRVIHESEIRKALTDIERYILNHLDMYNEESIFPIKVFKDRGELMYSDSLSWSYGDLGTILFLLELAHYEQNEDKQDSYRKLLHHALEQVESSYKASEDNLGLRHGMGGQIMVLNRLSELLPHDHLLQKVKNRQTEIFSTLVKQRTLSEWVFERDLGAKTLLNNLTSDAGLNLGRLFAL